VNAVGADQPLSAADERKPRRRARHRGSALAARPRLLTAGLLLLAGTFGLVAPAVASASATAAPAVNLTWLQENPASSPSNRAGASTAFDTATDQLLMFGGYGNEESLDDDTWSWNGTTWVELHPATSPPARWDASMAYDASSGQLLLFGGGNASDQDFDDTWAWNGTTWVQLYPATSPSIRVGASMAYDPALHEIVLFGGANTTTLDGDSWVWNGATWAELHPTGSTPALRNGAGMAYDTATSQLVLFGGYGTGNTPLEATLGDTWTFNGSAWSEAGPSTSPPALANSSMAYDPTSGQIVLFGGFLASGTSENGTTWSWTGSTWVEATALAVSPLARGIASMDYDSATNQLVLFGGSSLLDLATDDVVLDADTWVYEPEAAPAIMSAGTATFTTGSSGSFAVTATGNPGAITFSEAGGLPAGLSFSSSGVLSGTPANGTGGAYDIVITASNGIGTPATQTLVVLVDSAPVITSLHSATFVVGSKGKFTVTTVGAYPAPNFSETGTLPSGVTLSSSGLLSGTPEAEGSYPIVLKATNAAGSGTQKFTLTIDA
jgi:hypothetical protein